MGLSSSWDPIESLRIPQNPVESPSDCMVSDEIPLEPQVLIEPFDQWALDFVGPINLPSNGKKYILVCTNYVTKWVEAKAMARATEETMILFFFEEIFVIF